MAHPGGRPLMYGTPAELKKAMDTYFESLWEEDWREEYDKDSKTKEWVQKLDHNGNPLMKLKELPTITGLAKHLHTSRETLMNYQGKDEFYGIVKEAKDLCEYWAEKSATEGTCNYALGIFKLKNFGWTDAIQITNTGNGDTLTADEINAQIQAAKKREKTLSNEG